MFNTRFVRKPTEIIRFKEIKEKWQSNVEGPPIPLRARREASTWIPAARWEIPALPKRPHGSVESDTHGPLTGWTRKLTEKQTKRTGITSEQAETVKTQN